jgi:hypothetical protein
MANISAGQTFLKLLPFRHAPNAVGFKGEARVGAGIHQQRQLGAVHLCIWGARQKDVDCLFQAAEWVRSNLTTLHQRGPHWYGNSPLLEHVKIGATSLHG